MNEPNQVAKAGTLLCVDRGAYSDYQVTGFFVVLREFDPRAELNEYLATPIQHSQDSFLTALIAKGFLLEIEYGNIYLGSYWDFDDFGFTPS